MGACGQGSPAGSNPLGVIILAAEKTEQAGTARMSMDMEMDGPSGLITSTAEGAFDMASKRGHMTMEMDMAEAPAGTPDMGQIEAVFDGTVIYMKMPALSAQIPGGKPWISYDLQKAGEQLGLDLGALMQAGTSDPTQSLQYLRGASGDVEVIGEEEIRGVTATHYRASVSFAKIAEQAPEEAREAVEATVKQLEEWVGADEMPIDVWIDSEGRMVRQTQSFEYAAGPASGTSVTMTMEMYDFGVDVDIEVPPASDVTDIGALMEEMEKPGTAP
jgi:hypothetical protein